MNLSSILFGIPDGLRIPLIEEYNSIIKHFTERKWTSSELSGGKFSEIVYTILEGYSAGSFKKNPSKPRNMVEACRDLEKNINVPRSFQILIPRMLPALYEVRNNRNVGHVGGDVDPNMMDSQLVVSTCSWIMAEIIRVFHNTTTEDAQKAVDIITERRIPLIWSNGLVKRVLNPKLSIKDQILLLVHSCSTPVSPDLLYEWTEYKNVTYFRKLLDELHQKRLVEYSKVRKQISILPPGEKYVEETIKNMQP